ncbi:glycosyltransferase family 2 protein [Sphingobacterium oryzagri]|uniref:Glycosyltransferase family 2 protein n=1 Tax=Sphingobacterium oryzagri TaxID=3025669 RepID=A0ABY7WHE5_9SPHI|nr:glycosyltransferase family 2 protein [Sphingobacterium sp. KACC 22765]WDF68972.1 glycosyltransferase family 2 protein [Sphingobacterium sp. KACC 22765]
MQRSKIKVAASIVLYNNDRKVLLDAVSAFLAVDLPLTFYLIDNSPLDSLRDLIEDSRVHYIHNPSNPGFGAAHNVAIQLAIEEGNKYHFVINPDVRFEHDIIKVMIEAMENDNSIGMLMPQILNEDGTIQYLPKLLPSPLSVLKRVFNKRNGWFKSFVEKYELRSLPADLAVNVPIISGCFTLFRVSALEEVGLYDDVFFMYFEDWDISRRMHRRFITLYYPQVSIVHGYESGANKNSRLFKVFIQSYIHYFNKWGWFFDRERKMMNAKILKKVK